ncbi:MAG: phospho-N-acetylmuramoyl-pentapeptide-transferase [Oscillospiraceae bacterium]|nr:phospho-N-acetylmuramoyl-pentapeptide-transferase [Oscillospiraceae bacterium]
MDSKLIALCMAAILSFAVAVLTGKLLIPFLQKMKAGQSIKTDGPTWHMSKQGTPTMGGLIFIVSILATIVTCAAICRETGNFQDGFVVFGFALVFGLIGMVDDVAKLKKKENTGLTAGWKFLLQLSVSIAFTVLLRYTGQLSPNLYIPFLNVELILNWPVYMAFSALVMVGTVNAVNITDGVDGLAAGVTAPVALFYAAAAYVIGQMSVGVFSAALFGGLVGFLMFNANPAKVFMGDTGSLFLGGAVCGLAFALNVPLILLFVGIIYILETLSDILQVIYFKVTHGRRIFRMAPLHHHLEMGGWNERKICAVFTAITVIGCVAAWLGIANRLSV